MRERMKEGNGGKAENSNLEADMEGGGGGGGL
jgi:hypothetical protein